MDGMRTTRAAERNLEIELRRVSYHFDDFAVEPVAFRLFKAGEAVHIEPKALQILIFLLERREQLVTKQELLGEIWPDVAVTENALTRAIAQLRKTLGDDADAPRYIETVPTRGYRFIGILRNAPEEVPTRAKRGRYLLLIPVIAIAMVLAMQGLISHFIIKNVKRVRRIGVQAPPPPIAARLLRSSPHFQFSPSFSPDGGWVVYSTDVDGTPHLFISPIDGDKERQLTDGEAGEAQPSWSPDGKRIAFVSVRKGGIWLIDANGGEPKPLTTFGSRPSWSPDGTEIAFQSAEDIEYGWTAYDALPPSAIWIVDVASRKTAALTVAGNPSGGHCAPSWRSYGSRIAFSSCDNERCGVFTIARDATGLTEVASDPRRLASPVFAVDGRTIYYVQLLYNASLLLGVSVDADGSRVSDTQRFRQSNPGVIQHLALSRDGFRFAWSVVEEKSDLFAIDVGSSSPPMQLTKNPMVSPTFPSFSPDGKKIAYVTVAAGDDSGIWISDADGSNARALVTGPGLKQYARWGKGEWDVFYSAWSVDAHRPVPYRASLISGRAEVAGQLPEDASAPAFSRDLQSIAFNRTIGGKTSVWISAPDGSSLRRMSEDDDLARFPIWSPSGKHLAVQLRRGGSSIAILPGQKVLLKGGENWPHSWSSDEKEIAFAGRRNGVWNVWTVNVESGRTRQLTNFTSTTGWVRTPCWSPDGKRIVFEAGAPRGNVWISEPRVAQ
jgi:Tol biopolymer transport system component/DNA-binding winged helix-turn-helix (wHTH) protein